MQPSTIAWLLAAVSFAQPGLPSSVHAQEIQLSTPVDSVFVGERFPVTVKVDLEAGYAALFPDLAGGPLTLGEATYLRPLEISNAADISVDHWDSAIYEVAVFGVDSAVVGRIPVGILSPYGDTLVAESASTLIRIRSVVPEEAAGLRDLAPLATFPPLLWPWILGGVALLALIAGAYYLWKRRSRSVEESVQKAVYRDPYDEAATRLRTLADLEPVTPEETRRYYIELSDTLRTYLEFTIDVPALERTSSELMLALRRLAAVSSDLMEQNTLDQIGTSLDVSDLAKFANHQPDRARNAEILELTRQSIESIERARRRRLAEAQSEYADV
jgi:hypothetical protein